jgi:hypothetical protein
MTWHQIFDLSTLEERHLLAVYAVVFVVQIGFFAYVAWNWSLSKPPRD